MLTAYPFKNWNFKKSYDDDLELINYIFTHNGIDIVCDRDNKISTIFLYADETRCFVEELQDIPLSATRQEVIDHFGVPSRSGTGISDPKLGEHGAWDRFSRPSYYIHFEYRANADRINLVTLMRADVVP